MRRAKAFTLVELLVVVAIIAVLVAIVVPSLGRARELARRAVCMAQQHQIGNGLTMYAHDFSHVMPPGNSTCWPWYGIDSTWSSNGGSMGLAFLITEGYVPEPRVFYCPSWKHPYHRYDVLDAAGDDPVGGPNCYGGWPAPPNPGPLWHRGISYQYRSTFGLALEDGSAGRGRPPRTVMEGNPAIAADHWSRRYVLWANFGHPDGYVTLHLDGHSSWVPDPEHAFMDDMCEFYSHGDWGEQEFLWSEFFDGQPFGVRP